MTKTIKRPFRAYSGALATPIFRNRASLLLNEKELAAFFERESLEVFKQRLEKLDLLLKHFAIGAASKEGKWCALAYTLAINHVPGFQTIFDDRETSPAKLRGLAAMVSITRKVGLAASDTEACKMLAEIQLNIAEPKRRPTQREIAQRQKTLQNRVVEGRRLSRKSSPVEPG